MYGTMIMEGFAAQKGGLKIGDEILKINRLVKQNIKREAGKHMPASRRTGQTPTIKRLGQPEPGKQFKRKIAE